MTTPMELSGLLNKALGVFPNLRQRGFTVSPSMKKALETFRKETDPLAIWLERATILGSEVFVGKQPLCDAYNKWAYQNNSPTMSAKEFGTRVRGLRPMLREKQRRIHEKMMWVWLGLGMRDDAHTP